MKHVKDKMIPAVLILVLLVIWEAAVDLLHIPLYVLPSPLEVVKALFTEGTELFSHGLTTVGEGLLGILIASALSLVLGISMDWFPAVRKGLYPILVVTQTVPMIVMAPILIIYMGFGMAPKITLVVITTFFPITIGLLDGYKSVDPDAIRLMTAMGASRAQIFRHVKFPGALPQFFSGLKISASYAVVGAVVSEWLGGFNGLGVYMTRVKKAYSFDKMFAVIIFIVIISLLLLLAVNIVSRITMPWLQVEKEKNNE